MPSCTHSLQRSPRCWWGRGQILEGSCQPGWESVSAEFLFHLNPERTRACGGQRQKQQPVEKRMCCFQELNPFPRGQGTEGQDTARSGYLEENTAGHTVAGTISVM